MTKKPATKSEKPEVKLGNKRKTEVKVETTVPATVSALAKAVSQAKKAAVQSESEVDTQDVSETPSKPKMAALPPARPAVREETVSAASVMTPPKPTGDVTTLEEVLASRHRTQKPRGSGRFDPSKYLS